MSDATPSRGSSSTAHHDKRNESEAQSRGIYGSSRSPTSNTTYLGRFELKRPGDDKATDRSIKRRRDVEEEKDEDEDEPKSVNASDSYNMLGLSFKQYCEDFVVTSNGKSLPRAYLQRLEHEQVRREDSPPKKVVKVVTPSKDGSERQQASHNGFDPMSSSRQASQLQEPAHMEQGQRETAKLGGLPTFSTQLNILPRDPRLRRGSALTPLVSPLQSSQMSSEPGNISSVKYQMLGKPPSNLSQRRPLGVDAIPSQASARQEEYQPYSSTQREARVPPASGGKKEDVSRASGRKDEDHPSAPSQNKDHPSRAADRGDSHPSQTPARNEDHLVPPAALDEHSADDSHLLIDARWKLFEEEERVKQQQHQEDLARKKLQQRKEFEFELDEAIKQKKHDADMARKAAVQKQEEEHERRLAELRRR
ncbi:MAG: hypothetical protein Q9161_000373 [Pseudevernia consocians]